MSLAVSVIVPAYDAEPIIGGCLAALDRQTLGPERYEVIVVDDGSTDGTAAAVRGFAGAARAPVRLVEQPRNRGPAAARNAGLAVAAAPVVAFTDADCEPAPDWLERALARLEDPSVAAVEGRIEPKGASGPLTHQMRNTTGGQFMTANMVYRRRALDDGGGFDERFRAAYLEDSDVAFGVLESGGRIAWEPGALVHHLVLAEGRRKFWRDARKHYFNPLLYKKHPATYVERLRPLRPAFPRSYVTFVTGSLVMLAGAILLATGSPWPCAALLAAPAFPVARAWWRISYIHRARDPVSFLQAGLYPFVHTFWVLAGALRFRAFSAKL